MTTETNKIESLEKSLSEKAILVRVGETYYEDDGMSWLQALEAIRDGSLDKCMLPSLSEACAYRIIGDQRYKGLRTTCDFLDLYKKQGDTIHRWCTAQIGDYSNKSQTTRTCAVYMKEGNNLYVAFDDIQNFEQNIILARFKEGLKLHSEDLDWILPKKDKHISQILQRAKESDRIVKISEDEVKPMAEGRAYSPADGVTYYGERGPIELSTKQLEGKTKFGNHKIVRAMLGNVAEPYAKMIGYTNWDWDGTYDRKGLVYVLNLRDDKKIKNLGSDEALVCMASLDSLKDDVIYAVSSLTKPHNGLFIRKD